MTTRKEGEDDYKNKDTMGKSHETSQPPACKPEAFEKDSVEEGEQPSIDEMDYKPHHFGSISIGRYDGPEEKRHIHARETEGLTGAKECCQKTGG
jgi:hypothetical protein